MYSLDSIGLYQRRRNHSLTGSQSRLIERPFNGDNIMLAQSTPTVETPAARRDSDRPVQQAMGLWREQRL